MRGILGPLQETIFLGFKIIAFLLLIVIVFNLITEYTDSVCVESTTQSINDLIDEIKGDSGSGFATISVNKQCIDAVVIADKQPNIGAWTEVKCYSDQKNEGGTLFITYYKDAGFSEYISSVKRADITEIVSHIKRSVKNKCQYAPLILTYASFDAVKAGDAKLEIRGSGSKTYSGVYLPSDKNEEITKYCIHYTIKEEQERNVFQIDSITSGEC
ncbi:MAG: hypothetical protein JW716_00495 [Candidatus Aenigmarchaeota archaeon]|nr:hypothetical protein [Candidatus Aenigmarchaeota archaeon]